jgi:hypothetical protein
VAEGQVLHDPINIRRCEDRALAQGAAALGALALKQMAPAGSVKNHLSAGGDFEPFGYGLSCFNSFGASHGISSS